MLGVVLHIFPTAFFIATKNQSHFALEGDTCFLNRIHCKKSGNGWPFVIRRATTIHMIAFDYCAKGINLPTVPSRHNIQMRQDGEWIGANLAHTNIANIVVKIANVKAHVFGIV